MVRVEIDKEICKGCGLCVEVCPKGVIEISSRLNDMGEHPAEGSSEEECTGCALCAVGCPDCAIRIVSNQIATKTPRHKE